MHEHHGSHGCCDVSDIHRVHRMSTCCCGVTRRFMTKAERHKALESYRDELKNELAGVEERLENLSA